MPSTTFPTPHTVGTAPLGPNRTADLDAVRQQFYNERGYPSAFCWEQARSSSSILKLFEKIKMFFPAGQGDTLRKLVMSVSGPTERDVLGWSRVGEAAPGYSPAATTFRDTVKWGHEFRNASLYTDAVRTDPFARMDLFFKPKLQEQMMNVSRAMSEYTRLTWEYWLPSAVQRNSVCTVLNSQWGDPEEVGSYPTHLAPVEIFDHGAAEVLYKRMYEASRVFGELGKDLPDRGERQLVIIGDGAFTEFELRYKQAIHAIGFQSADVMIPELGNIGAKRIGKYDFIVISHPRRFRQRNSGETWEDALLPSFITVPAEGGKGVKRAPNPDYSNPAIAKYEEILMPNMDAYEWYVPPAGLDVKGVDGKAMFKPTQYSGEFMLITPSTDSDPFGDTAYFACRFMAGFMPLNQERSRAVMAQAVHATRTGVTLIQNGPGMENNPTYSIQQVVQLINGNLQVLIAGSLPANAPIGKSLFIVRQNGGRALVGTIVANNAFAGSSQQEPGRILELSFPAGIQPLTPGTLDNPWTHLAFLPQGTPNDLTTGKLPTLFLRFATDSVVDVVNSALASIVVGEPFATAAALQAALNAYLGANGTATVTGGDAATGFVWDVTVASATETPHADFTALRTGFIRVSDGIGISNLPFLYEDDDT